MAVILTFLYFTLSIVFTQNDKLIISEKLMNQAKCWNSGDLDCFMEDYWKNDSLMYIGKNGITFGWQNTLENYKKRYPTKNEMGQLSFEILMLDQLGDEHYFIVGKWFLARKIGDISGHFSLIWKKIDKEWVIVSDHSS